ncbi:hypothetical protein J2S43_002637 [Catenuloplanes nepalensis]|uniref:Uncharacterized protein n=1 Tax=Catenuloplanes nepalensis TaxID=587533 RepID=A0ABT9MRR9_9ACTN|nr:hypothetical protein [Catenuloplanes nepalensis]MDP9794125.1 hypothetical protein [Catenuloplanes nepalensis]
MTKAVDARAELIASVAALDDGNYEFRHDSYYYGLRTGIVHAPSDAIELGAFVSGEGGSEVEYRRIGDEIWLRMDFSRWPQMTGEVPDTLDGELWATPLPGTDRLGGMPFARPGDDITGARSLVGSVRTVTRTGSSRYAGTFDLTRVTAGEMELIPDEPYLRALGDRARSLPFHAETDVRGRLKIFTFDLPELPRYGPDEMSLLLSEYGTARAPQRPGDGEIAGPDDMAEMKKSLDAMDF